MGYGQISQRAAQSHYAPSGAGDDSPDRWLRRAARYALRASRSVVVSLNLSRRNAASESEESKKDCRTCDSPFSYAISGSTEAIWNRPPLLSFHWMSSSLSSCRSSWPFR